MTNPSATFNLDKRAFLHHKLDDILHSWARKTGHGTFFLSVTDGIPNFQFGLQLDLCDVATNPEPPLPPARQDHHHQEAPQRVPQGKKARNRARAARFQAAKAAASAAASTESRTPFPGQGKLVGTAPKPVLSLPLKKGDVFPPQSNSTSSTTTSATTSSSVVRSPPPSTSASTMSSSLAPAQPTNFRVPLKVKDAVLSDDSDDETEEFYDCGQCNSEIDSNAPSYYCPLCVKCFHVQCITGHKCISFV